MSIGKTLEGITKLDNPDEALKFFYGISPDEEDDKELESVEHEPTAESIEAVNKVIVQHWAVAVHNARVINGDVNNDDEPVKWAFTNSRLIYEVSKRLYQSEGAEDLQKFSIKATLIYYELYNSCLSENGEIKRDLLDEKFRDSLSKVELEISDQTNLTNQLIQKHNEAEKIPEEEFNALYGNLYDLDEWYKSLPDDNELEIHLSNRPAQNHTAISSIDENKNDEVSMSYMTIGNYGPELFEAILALELSKDEESKSKRESAMKLKYLMEARDDAWVSFNGEKLRVIENEIIRIASEIGLINGDDVVTKKTDSPVIAEGANEKQGEHEKSRQELLNALVEKYKDWGAIESELNTADKEYYKLPEMPPIDIRQIDLNAYKKFASAFPEMAGRKKAEALNANSIIVALIPMKGNESDVVDSYLAMSFIGTDSKRHLLYIPISNDDGRQLVYDDLTVEFMKSLLKEDHTKDYLPLGQYATEVRIYQKDSKEVNTIKTDETEHKSPPKTPAQMRKYIKELSEKYKADGVTADVKISGGRIVGWTIHGGQKIFQLVDKNALDKFTHRLESKDNIEDNDLFVAVLPTKEDDKSILAVTYLSGKEEWKTMYIPMDSIDANNLVKAESLDFSTLAEFRFSPTRELVQQIVKNDDEKPKRFLNEPKITEDSDRIMLFEQT